MSDSPTQPDVKVMLEVGAAIMLDKPIILQLPPGRTIPKALRRAAASIVEGDISNKETVDKLQSVALEHIVNVGDDK